MINLKPRHVCVRGSLHSGCWLLAALVSSLILGACASSCKGCNRHILSYNTSWIIPDSVVYTSSAAELAHCKSDRKLDVVLTSFNESQAAITATISKLLEQEHIRAAKACFFLYDKGGPGRNLSGVSNVYQVVKEVNLGSGGQSILKHIRSHYHKLPSQVISMHAVPKKGQLFWHRFSYFNSDTGFLPLGEVGPSFCDGNSTLEGNSTQRFVQLRELWAIFRGDLCEEPFIVGRSPQFAVSSQRILMHPLRKYLLLLAYLFGPKNHPIHSEITAASAPAGQSQADSSSNTLLQNVLSRSWTFIYNCQDPHFHAPCCDAPVANVECKVPCQCTDI